MALANDITNLPATLQDGHTGHLANHQTIHAALKDHQSRLDGVEGRIPDALKLSRDTTVGAVIKAGSSMIYGDTGWRNITSLLDIPPNSGSLFIKRTAQHTHLRATSLQYNSGVSPKVTIPRDWWTNAAAGFQLYNTNGVPAANVNTTAQGVITLIWNTNLSANSQVTFSTSASWPTEMIGV